MGELANAIRQFIMRDLVYIFAGAILLLCVWRTLSPKLCPGDFGGLSEGSSLWVALGVGASYAVAYLLQELFCLVQFCSTAIEGEPGRLTRWLFLRYNHRDWVAIQERLLRDPQDEVFNAFEAERIIEGAEERRSADYERRVALVQLSTSVGPCAVVGGGILLIWSYYCPIANSAALDRAAGWSLLVAGILFIILGWLKRAQLREYLFRVSLLERSKFSKEKPVKEET